MDGWTNGWIDVWMVVPKLPGLMIDGFGSSPPENNHLLQTCLEKKNGEKFFLLSSSTHIPTSLVGKCNFPMTRSVGRSVD